MSNRTLVVKSPHMKGSDVGAWQSTLNRQMSTWGVSYRLDVDEDYGIATRDLTATVLYGLGFGQNLMESGVTPALRIKVRDKRQNPAEKARYAARSGWRKRLKARHAGGGVARPVNKIEQSSWGYVPGVHDGIDVICPKDSTLYAMVHAKVIDARSGGWWGKAPSGDVTKGDGIIQLEVLTSVGPFRKGMHIGYGHAEHASVKVGQEVRAGQAIGKAGLAVVPHIHLMLNDGQTSKGVGTRDPRACLNYAIKNG